MKMTVSKIIDLPNEWGVEKITRLGDFLYAEYGFIEPINLYIDHESFDKLRQDFNALKQYNNFHADPREDVTSICLFTRGAKLFIIPTIEDDYVTFTSAAGVDYSYKITNKTKVYNKDFEEIVND